MPGTYVYDAATNREYRVVVIEQHTHDVTIEYLEGPYHEQRQILSKDQVRYDAA